MDSLANIEDKDEMMLFADAHAEMRLFYSHTINQDLRCPCNKTNPKHNRHLILFKYVSWLYNTVLL